MKFRIAFFGVLAASAASPAIASPVYLTCVFGNPDRPIEVTVDEAESTATVFIPQTDYS